MVGKRGAGERERRAGDAAVHALRNVRRQFDEQLAVLPCRGAGAEYSAIAIEFNGEPKSGERKPGDRIPRHERDRATGGEQEHRITGGNVRLFVRDDQPLFMGRALEQPGRDRNPWCTDTDHRRAECFGDAHGNAVDVVQRGAMQLRAMTAIAHAERQQQEC